MADAGFPPQPRLVILDQRNIGAGSTHVERQHIGVTAVLGDPHRPGDPAGWTRHQQIDWRIARFFRRHQPAIGAQQAQLGVGAPILQFTLQIADIA